MSDSKPTQSVINTATVSAIFRDGDSGISEELTFGQSITKKFTIENTGTAEARVKMFWNKLVNTYLAQSLTYTLSYAETEEGPYTEIIAKTNVPQSTNPSKKILAQDLSIPADKTYYYNLVVTLNYLEDVNQDSDLDAVFYTDFTLEDINEKYYVTFNANGGEVETSSKTITENEVYGTLPTPVRTNYEFLGWYTGIDNGIQITENSIIELNETHTLYARWKRLPLSEIITKSSKGNLSSFDPDAVTDEGIYEMQDDYGTSYYYRGTSENNYVKFAGYYWRIIRLNGNGSLRIIYDGTSAHANGESSDDRYIKVSQPFNAKYNDAKYVGWMFGGNQGVESTSKTQAQRNDTNSDIKTVVDTWYKTNIKDRGYGSYVSDTLFCNDRSIPGKSVTKWTSDTGLGYAKNATAYAALGRYMSGNNSASLSSKTKVQPIFTCSQKADRFTVYDTSKGNGALTYPVGLITADEVVAAGSGKHGTYNNKYYLYKSSKYRTWTLTPYSLDTSGYANVFYISSSGQFNENDVSYATGAVAPVINLSAEYISTMEGDGTMESPYTA